MSGDDVVEASFSDALTGRDASRRYRTAISTDLADGLPKILALRARAAARACARATTATPAASSSPRTPRTRGGSRRCCGRRAASRRRSCCTPRPAPTQKLQAFRTGRDPWIVAVNMVSEGVDIPRLRVGVYATAAKTPLIFRQIVGRFVRTIPGRPAGEHSWVYLPGDPVLRVHAGEVETELRHVLRAVEEPDGPARRAARERQRSEPSEELAFVPRRGRRRARRWRCSAAARRRPRRRPSPFLAPQDAAEEEPEDEVPAWERRARLRDKRHGLVASLRRLDGRSFREINAWLNRDDRRDPRRRRVDRAARALDRPAARRAGSPLGRRAGLTPDR